MKPKITDLQHVRVGNVDAGPGLGLGSTKETGKNVQAIVEGSSNGLKLMASKSKGKKNFVEAHRPVRLDPKFHSMAIIDENCNPNMLGDDDDSIVVYDFGLVEGGSSKSILLDKFETRLDDGRRDYPPPENHDYNFGEPMVRVVDVAHSIMVVIESTMDGADVQVTDGMKMGDLPVRSNQ
ncbi:hypothetical protein GOBAR_DD08844 [Gossypium barbadense]|nr:hypothetical protein GOBAR_DD08844 [Gossypium barbadense]